MSWAVTTGDVPSTKLAVAYADFNFQNHPTGKDGEKQSTNAYIWDINNPNEPEMVLQAISPLCCIQFNPKKPDHIVGGMYNGLLGAYRQMIAARSSAFLSPRVESSFDAVRLLARLLRSA